MFENFGGKVLEEDYLNLISMSLNVNEKYGRKINTRVFINKDGSGCERSTSEQ